MEDRTDSLFDLFKKPDSIHFVQIQSRVSQSPAVSSSKDNSVSNVRDSGSVLSEILQKPKKCMVSSTNSVSQDVTPNPANQNIDAEDTVVCKKKKLNFKVLQSTNCSSIFGNTPSSLCESVARLPKRQKKCLKNADTKITSLSVQFSACHTTESSFVLPKKQPAKQSPADQRISSKALSLFEKSEPSFLSHTFPSAHNLSVTSNGPESSVVLNKRKSTLKASERCSTTNLFDSEPSSVCESFIEKRKTKPFRNDSTHQLFSPKDSSECSNVNDGNEFKLTRKASFVDKENMDVNFDNMVSSVSDSIVLKRGGGFLNTFNKTKDCAVNASVNIFGHPEGLSDDCESSSESEESEKDPTSNTCEDESSSCREPESTNRSASTFEDESSSSYKEPESTQKSTSFDQQESIADADNSTRPSEGDLSVTCQDQNSVLGGNRSLHKSASFREGSTILASSVDNIPPKFDLEVNESSIDKFILTLEMSEQQKSVESSALDKADGVSFAQPDCTRFSMTSGNQTQATDASVSLVSKMFEDKSTVKGGRKMAPPKQAPKKRRKPLPFEFDSDDDEPPADDSISTLPKQPNFPKFHPWCGKQFYSRIVEKMRPKYGVKTNVEAVRLAEYVWKSVRQVEACSDADANHAKVEEMKRTLARKQIVVTHYQFYIFCIQNLPPIFHQRALPMGPLFPCKFDLTKAFDPILADS